LRIFLPPHPVSLPEARKSVLAPDRNIKTEPHPEIAGAVGTGVYKRPGKKKGETL
jgi:hypothetical protein